MSSGYIELPVTTDPDELAAVAFTELQSRISGWVPAAGNLETILTESFSLIAAILATQATLVAPDIFRYFGSLVGIFPVDATTASTTTTWTMRDDAGYTISAGTQVGIRTAGDTLIPFRVLNDVVVAPGSTVTADGEVVVVAVTAGAAGSGLGTIGGPVELIDTPFDYVTGIVQTEVTTGGIDAEDGPTYLNRLSDQLRLLTPRPIIPSDYAVLAQSIAGVARALAIDGYSPAMNELETVTVNATGGTFKLTFETQQTAAIAWNATAADVQTALEALSNIAPGDVNCTGGPLATAPVQVEFEGTYLATDVTQMTADSTSLTGGSHTATVATTRAGAAALTDQERTIAVAIIDESGHDDTSTVKANVQAFLSAKREVNFVVNVIDPTYTNIDVTFEIATYDGYDPDTVVAAAEQAVTDFLDPANWGLPPTGDRRDWLDTPVVRYLEVAQAINQTAGVDYVSSLTIGVHGDSPGTTDITMDGPAALPEPADIAGTAA